MAADDPIGDLVLLARAAADAGEAWRTRLRREWLPAVLASAVESAVLEAMAASGYD